VNRLRFALRLARRITIVAIVGACVGGVGMQYAHMVAKNVALAQHLAAVQADVQLLEAKRADADREIRRLSDPAGAVPEIHDKLHLVGDHEAIIYLKRHGDGP
jgi:hypothetical protein